MQVIHLVTDGIKMETARASLDSQNVIPGTTVSLNVPQTM
uniref:Uncharacterized protein n=1 Tax=Anguilla anguilla TaxID=7936 RepID=A0A0E9PM67_ANGAN